LPLNTWGPCRAAPARLLYLRNSNTSHLLSFERVNLQRGWKGRAEREVTKSVTECIRTDMGDWQTSVDKNWGPLSQVELRVVECQNVEKWKKWPKMTKNDQKWPKMTKNDQKWPKMTKNDQKWPKMTKNEQKWPMTFNPILTAAHQGLGARPPQVLVIAK
jgi:hypothetical protein